MLSTRTGLSPTLACLSRQFRFLHSGHWPGPRSLATTSGVSVDVLSSGYLDVSVRRVRLAALCIQTAMTQRAGFPHSEIRGSKFARNSPRLIATCYVLHRLSVPRHSPDALQRLITRNVMRRDEPGARFHDSPGRQSQPAPSGTGRHRQHRTQPLHNDKEHAAGTAASNAA